MWEGAKGGGVYDLGVGRVRKLFREQEREERNGRGGRGQFTVEGKNYQQVPIQKDSPGVEKNAVLRPTASHSWFLPLLQPLHLASHQILVSVTVSSVSFMSLLPLVGPQQLSTPPQQSAICRHKLLHYSSMASGSLLALFPKSSPRAQSAPGLVNYLSLLYGGPCSFTPLFL